MILDAYSSREWIGPTLAPGRMLSIVDLASLSRYVNLEYVELRDSKGVTFCWSECEDADSERLCNDFAAWQQCGPCIFPLRWSSKSASLGALIP